MKETLYIVIPAYNEQANIEHVIDDWYAVVSQHDGDGRSRLVIIDDGSTDSTYTLADSRSRELPMLEVMTKRNQGHGPTVLFGYRYALSKNADWVFQTDADGQTLPEEFVHFWENRVEYDAVIGKRIVRGDGFARKIVEDVVCILLRLVFGVKLQDANAPYRLMSSGILSRHIGRLPDDYDLPNIMLTTYFSYFGEHILFVPITFRQRQGGSNSINVKRIVAIGWKALGDFVRLRRNLVK